MRERERERERERFMWDITAVGFTSHSCFEGWYKFWGLMLGCQENLYGKDITTEKVESI